MYKNAGNFPSDVVPAKFLKCSRDKDTLQTRLAFKEMKTEDGA